jgi:hypothetical protein
MPPGEIERIGKGGPDIFDGSREYRRLLDMGGDRNL